MQYYSVLKLYVSLYLIYLSHTFLLLLDGLYRCVSFLELQCFQYSEKSFIENEVISQWTRESLGWISCSFLLRMNKLIVY